MKFVSILVPDILSKIGILVQINYQNIYLTTNFNTNKFSTSINKKKYMFLII